MKRLGKLTPDYVKKGKRTRIPSRPRRVRAGFAGAADQDQGPVENLDPKAGDQRETHQPRVGKLPAGHTG